MPLSIYRSLWLVSSLTVLLWPRLLMGQAVKGSLLGTITDASGAVVPGAKVVITEANTGFSRWMSTNQSGYYVFSNLENGTYRVTVEQPGFQTAVRENVEVFVNSTVRVDFALTPGQVNERINVVAEAPPLQTDRSDTGRRIESRQIADMPLGYNRNFQGLWNLVPGATRVFRPHSEFFNPQDSLSTRVNGQSRLSSTVQLEGVDDNMRGGQVANLIPAIEALATADVTTSNYEAELGRAGGAITNLTLRSGTNQLHGSVFEFNRVSRLGARNVFANTKAPTTYNLYGFTIGGPIRKNKTFFFGDFQGIKDRRGNVFQATIPTMPFRTGDLSTSPTTIYDPATGTATGTARQPFPGNIIPVSRISPISRTILGFVPPPTFSGFQTNFQKATVRKKDSDSTDVKIDHQVSDNDRVSGHYSFQRPIIEDPPLFGLAGGGGKGFAGTGIQRTHSANLNYTHIFSPTFITEFRFGLQRHRNDAQNADFGTNASDAIGIPGVNIIPFTSGLTQINVNGYANPLVGYDPNLPWVKAETTYTYVTSWTKILSNHTIKWGADIRRIQDNNLQLNTFGVRGVFNSTPGPTSLNGNPNTGFANSFASFLLDQPNSFGRDLPGVFPAIRQTQIFSYVQDKWQVSPKLTLDIGLRHELYLPHTPPHTAGFSNYDPDTNRLIITGVGKNPNDLGRTIYTTDFAPRFGVSYRVNEKTVLRGGYGISYVFLLDGSNVFAFNFPVRQSISFNALNSFSAAGSMGAGFPPPQFAVIPPDGIIQNAPDQAYNVLRLDVREGYVQSWNLTVQRAVAAGFTFEAAYVGNHGIRMPAVRNINAGLVPGLGAAGQPLFQKFGHSAQVSQLFYPTSSNYHALQVKFDRRFSGGFLLATSYTYSKAIDFTADSGGLAVPSNPRINRARADYDFTHNFVQSYIYELPFGRNRRWLRDGVGRWALGEWQVNGIFTAQSGAPLSLSISSAALNAPGNTNRPNLVGSGTPEIFGAVGKEGFWFDTSRFAPPPSATYGNVGRNILTGPGLVNLDFSVFRKFILTERFKLEFRFESLNFTNTPHFNNPGATYGNPGFGQVTTAQADQRQIQFGLKLSF